MSFTHKAIRVAVRAVSKVWLDAWQSMQEEDAKDRHLERPFVAEYSGMDLMNNYAVLSSLLYDPENDARKISV
ncbi:hypothetical protein DID88_004095 [Monilinia fructigena]|uniref:Uncharacterized protein n=1 Tax=Monilinia fructigena TaxID=38457 RepID=A0A395IXE6_9HELO|nr:hypothetical protein DID88_004095 [Monilinia fructigena]